MTTNNNNKNSYQEDDDMIKAKAKRSSAASANSSAMATTSSNTVHEPDSLASASNHQTTRASANSPPSSPSRQQQHVSETRELKGMAKMWDEEDRQTKNKAKHSHGSGQDAPGMSYVPHNQPRRVSQEEQKIRNTYIQTGMKPGAFPDQTPDDHPVANNNGTASPKDTSMDRSDVETGNNNNNTYDNNGPLVEAFVVPDDDDNGGNYRRSQSRQSQQSSAVTSVSSPPPTKPGHVPPQVVSGDHYEKAQPASNLVEAETVNLTDLLLHKKMLMLIGCLVCFFVIVAVVVVVVIMVVVNGGDDNNTNNSSNNNMAPSDSTLPLGDDLVPTMAPSFVVPELNGPTMDPAGVVGDDDAVATTNAPTFAPATGTTNPPVAGTTTAPVAGTTTAPVAGVPDGEQQPAATEPPATEEQQPAATEPPVEEEEDTPAATDPPTPPPTEPPIAATPEPTPEPTEAPTFMELETDEPTFAPVPAATAPPLEEAVPAAGGSEATARVEFQLDYTVAADTTSQPSQDELNNLDAAAIDLFSTSVENGLSGSGTSLASTDMVSSNHAATGDGWSQSMVLDFTMSPQLPDINVFIDALAATDINDFRRSVVTQSIGPYFDQVTGAGYAFDIPTYGRRWLRVRKQLPYN